MRGLNDLGSQPLITSAANPAGYRPGMWIFTTLGFLGLLFSWLLYRSEKGPGGHGLEAVR